MDQASEVTAESARHDPTKNCIVRVADFYKRYGKSVAASGVTLDVKRGEIYGLIGPDGAGKSSLMKAIAGVLTFDSGEVEVLGTLLKSERDCERIKGRIGLMPQGLGQNLYPDLSVEENVDFFARLRLVDKRDLVARKSKLLAMTRLDRFKDRPMKQLSGGMKQKLGLVCTLIHEPELIILDEPTTGVDPVSRRDFWVILNELVQEKGITALVSTSYMDEAARFHRLALMFNGQVLAKGDPDEIQKLVSAGVGSEPELEDVFVALIHQEAGTARQIETPIERPKSERGTDLAVEAIDLTRDFGNFRAVDRATFTVRRGEIFGLLGANGAGKTTVIKMLTGLIRPTAGAGRVAGADMRLASHEIKERIGYMSQLFSLYLDLTVLENINLYAGIYGLSLKERRPRAQWVIDMAGLNGREDVLTASLPMGLRQRLALGCALVHRPNVLFLDEPTSGVDPVGRRQFWEILFSLTRQEGVTILVTTHYMSEAEHCDRLALMYAGRIVADAPPRQMKREVEAEAGQLLEITASHPFLAKSSLAAAGFIQTALFGKRIHLFSRNAGADALLIPRILEASGISGATVVSRPVSMEDAFVHRVTSLEATKR